LRILTLSDRVMKKTFLTLATFLLFSVYASSQGIVTPNRPFDQLGGTPGYFTMNEFTSGIGLALTHAPFSSHFVGFTTIHGYTINEHFTAGGGTGVLVYNSGTLVPLFLDFRYNIVVKKITPYLWADGGAAFNFSNIGELRLFMSPGAGARYAFSRKLAATLGAGFLMQTGINRDSFINVKTGITYKF
jgi:hypothetical protein